MSPFPLVRANRKQTPASRWVPENVRVAIIRGAAVMRGGLVIAVALAFAVSLLSYSPEDVSFNTAATANPTAHNWLGSFGGYVSDATRQFFGTTPLLLAVMLAAWGWRISTMRGIDLLRGRMAAVTFSMLAAGVGMSAIFPHASTDSPVWGGAIGKVISGGLLHLIPGIIGRAIVGAVMLVVTVGALYMASALTLDEWHALLKTVHQAVHMAARRIVAWLRFAWKFLRRESNDPVESPDEIKTAKPTDADKPAATNSENEKPATKPVAAPKRKSPVVQNPPSSTRQTSFPLNSTGYMSPPLELLQWPTASRQTGTALSREALESNAKMLESVLLDFGVQGQIMKVSPGPVVTLYELEPAPGTRAARVISLADDIARNMSAASVRVAVVPGRNVIGIELPNSRRETVYLRELMSVDAYTDHKGLLPLILGKDIAGAPIIVDLSRMPHLLIAGTTGSGKSVAINTMILSLLYRLPPHKCRFIMIDPKMLELSVYDGIPHLLAPVVTEPKKAIMALKWTVRAMEDRYRSMSKLGVRNIEGYNIRLREAEKNGENLMRTVQTGFDRETGKPIYEEQPLDLTELPYIVVIVDEMADLMLVAGKEIEGAVQRLAQMARAAGIHIVMATQRPSVDVITGTIKANFPTRVSFAVTSKIDSRTILGEQGAEQLLGMGDMLYMASGGRIVRVHGPFVRDDEVENIVKFLKSQGTPEYLSEVTEDSGDNGFDGESEGGFGGDSSGGGGSESNDMYDKAVDVVQRERRVSISFIQRQLAIGYNRAATIVERMEREGVVSSANHVGKREVLGRRMDADGDDGGE